MYPEGLAKQIAAAIPQANRRANAMMMLPVRALGIGIREVACPVCHHGYIDPVDLTFCPVCHGFQIVTSTIADIAKRLWRAWMYGEGLTRNGARNAAYALDLRSERGSRVARMAERPFRVAIQDRGRTT